MALVVAAAAQAPVVTAAAVDSITAVAPVAVVVAVAAWALVVKPAQVGGPHLGSSTSALRHAQPCRFFLTTRSPPETVEMAAPAETEVLVVLADRGA